MAVLRSLSAAIALSAVGLLVVPVLGAGPASADSLDQLQQVGCGEDSTAPAFGAMGATLASGTEVYAWTDLRDYDPYGSQNADVWAAASDDGGRTMGSSVRVSSSDDSDYLAGLTGSSAGVLAIYSGLTYATSADGRSWSEGRFPYPNGMTGIAADGDLALSIGGGGGLDTTIGRSTDGGRTWQPTPVNIRHNDVFADLRTIAVKGQLAVAAFNGWPVGGENVHDLYTLSSVDGGLTWTQPQRLAATVRDENEPRISFVDATRVVMTWVQQTSSTSFDVATATSSDAGATWTPPSLLGATGSSDYAGYAPELRHPTVTSVGGAIDIFASGGSGRVLRWTSTDSGYSFAGPTTSAQNDWQPVDQFGFVGADQTPTLLVRTNSGVCAAGAAAVANLGTVGVALLKPRNLALPTAPTGVVGRAGSASSVVSWSAPASDGGSPITGYTVTTSPGGASCSTTGALSCSVTGLNNGTSYSFTVTATNAVGTGPASAASQEVTPKAAASFKLGTNVLAAGQQTKLIVTGTPGDSIDVLVKGAASSSYTVIATVKPNAAGVAFIYIHPSTTSSYVVRNTRGTTAAQSLLVKAVQSLVASASGRTATFAGHVAPSLVGRTVTVYYYYTGGHVQVAGSTKVVSGGQFRLQKTFPAGSTIHAFAQTSADRYNAAGRSSVKDLTLAR